MTVLHLAASLPNPAIEPKRINPLRVVTEKTPFDDDEDKDNDLYMALPETDRAEIEKFIKEAFEPFFTKFQKMLTLTEGALIEMEDKHGYRLSESLRLAVGNLEAIVPNIQKANEFLNYALAKMPTLLVAEIFTEVCENPELCLESDMLI